MGEHTRPFQFPDLGEEVERAAWRRRIYKTIAWGAFAGIAGGMLVAILIRGAKPAPVAIPQFDDPGAVPIQDFGEGVFPNTPPITTSFPPNTQPLKPRPVVKKVTPSTPTKPAPLPPTVTVTATPSPPPSGDEDDGPGQGNGNRGGDDDESSSPSDA